MRPRNYKRMNYMEMAFFLPFLCVRCPRVSKFAT